MQVASQTRSLPEPAAEADAMTGAFGDLAVSGPSKSQPHTKLEILPYASPRSAVIHDPSEPPIPFSQPLPGVDPIDFTPYLQSVERTLDELSHLSILDQFTQIDDIVALLQGAVIDIFEGCTTSQVPQTLFSAARTMLRIARRVAEIQEEDVREGILFWGVEQEAVSPCLYIATCTMGLVAILGPSGGTQAAREAGIDEEIRFMLGLYHDYEDHSWFAYYQAWELIHDRPLPKNPWRDEAEYKI